MKTGDVCPQSLQGGWESCNKTLALLSILSVRDDYRMNDQARKAVLLAPRRRRTMKYICLGYIEPGKIASSAESMG